MRTRLFLFLLGLGALTAQAEKIPSLLMVWAKDGSRQTFALAQRPTVTFTDTDLVITAEGLEVNFDLDQVARFTYEDKDATGIAPVNPEADDFKLDGESVIFRNLKPNSRIAFFNADGKLCLRKEVRGGGAFAFSLSDLTPGVYVMQVNGITTKILKK